MHLGFEPMGRGGSVVVGAGGSGVRGLGLVGRGFCGWVWGWWVGVGRACFVLEGRCFKVWSWCYVGPSWGYGFGVGG